MSKIGHRKILERSGEWGSGWKDDLSFTLDTGCGRDLIIMEEPQKIKYIDLFAGVGGFRHGIEKVIDAECVYSNEWDKYANSVYRKHYGECDNRDIRDVKAEEIPDFDLLVGGFPCQSFSIAGSRGGFNDTRGTLFFEIARIAKQKQPRLLLLENVKGLLSHDKGRTFNTIISTLDELGYDAEWQVLNSKDFGVPQNRERVFIIGYLRGTGRPKVFPFLGSNEQNLKQIIGGGQGNRVYDSDGTSVTLASQAGGQGAKTGLYTVNNPFKGKTSCGWHLEQNIYSDNSLVRTLKSSEGSGNKPKVVLPVLTPDRAKKRQNGRRFKEDGDPSFTLTAQDKHGIYNGTKIRRLTPVECERLQGFPDNWTEFGALYLDEKLMKMKNQVISDTQRYKMMGNAVTTNVVSAIIERLFT